MKDIRGHVVLPMEYLDRLRRLKEQTGVQIGFFVQRAVAEALAKAEQKAQQQEAA